MQDARQRKGRRAEQSGKSLSSSHGDDNDVMTVCDTVVWMIWDQTLISRDVGLRCTKGEYVRALS